MKRFLDRLAALVPPPNANQLFYGGAFAPRSKLRRDVVAYQRPHVRRRPPASGRSAKRENPTWAELMRHSFGLDVLACPKCGGRLRHIATLQSPAAIRRILKHLSLWTEEATAPPRAPPVHEADEVTLAEIWEDEVWSQDPDDYAAEA